MFLRPPHSPTEWGGLVVLKCSICIHDERTATIDIINGKPICRECQVYLKHPFDREKIRRELDELMEKVDRAIVAYSGGKDSVVALYLAKEVYKVPELEAVMVDHGLMAEEASRTPGGWPRPLESPPSKSSATTTRTSSGRPC